MNISTWLKPVISTLLVIALIIGGYLIWENFKVKTITGQSQNQAETPSGIETAAKNAQIKMYQDQLDEAAREIAKLKNKPPDVVIQTVPVEVVKTVEKERERRGADFAIVTNPKEPDKQVDLKEIEKLPSNTPINLNQYNVYAYKKVIRGVTIYPKFNGLTPTGVSEVTFDVSRKISKDGKYLGVVGGYDFEHKKIKAGIRITY